MAWCLTGGRISVPKPCPPAYGSYHGLRRRKAEIVFSYCNDRTLVSPNRTRRSWRLSGPGRLGGLGAAGAVRRCYRMGDQIPSGPRGSRCRAGYGPPPRPAPFWPGRDKPGLSWVGGGPRRRGAGAWSVCNYEVCTTVRYSPRPRGRAGSPQPAGAIRRQRLVRSATARPSRDPGVRDLAAARFNLGSTHETEKIVLQGGRLPG